MFAKKLILTFLVTLLAVAPTFAQTGLRGRQPAVSADYLTRGDIAEAARDYLLSNESLSGSEGAMDFETLTIQNDKLGQSHIRFQPYINGMPIYGAQVIVHVNSKNRQVTRVDRDTKVTGNLASSFRTRGGSARAIMSAISSFGVKDYQIESKPELAYVLNDNREPVLSWNAMISYEDADGPQMDRIFADASNGKLITRHPEFHYARNRRTYDGNNGSSLPGSLVRTEGSGSSGDSCLDAAHNYAGNTYDYYSSVHGRDSYNGSGATMTSTVHHQNNYNNAFWNGSQMVYGDGDGSTFICLAQSLDVVAHELTHAVTETSAGLVYQNESGALNEAMSDIFGAAVEAMADGGVNSNTWKLGEDIYTPGTSGDALRYMNNPTTDGQSYDYYPERYTGSQDNGGVHINSGIANLAFYLLVQGGSHPRGKTTQSVSGIGIDKAAKIFYRALTVYMGPSTTFAQARTHTVQAAADLYGASSNEATQMGNAWTAVGVAGPAPTVEIANGQTLSGLSASSGSELTYRINVPSGASNLVISISGGSGDADLYTRYGSAPTDSSYDCRPYQGGNSESCTNASPAAGWHYIRVKAYSSFSNLSLTASYSGSTPNQAPNASFNASVNNLAVSFSDTSTDSDGSIASRSWNFGDGSSSTSANPSHTYASAGSYTVTLTVTDNDGASASTSQSVTVSSPPNGGVDEISNGQTITGLSATSGNDVMFKIVVPSGASNLVISTSGGSGDADLYTRFGAEPTDSTYDCRPYKSGNSESCSVASPNAGEYFIRVKAYSTYSNLSLTASFDEPGNGPGGDSTTVGNISASTGSWKYYTWDVPAGMSSLSIAISGGSGDADLYVRRGSQPTTSSYDYRPYLNGNNESVNVSNPTAGTYHIGIRAYSTFSGVTLAIEHQ